MFHNTNHLSPLECQIRALLGGCELLFGGEHHFWLLIFSAMEPMTEALKRSISLKVVGTFISCTQMINHAEQPKRQIRRTQTTFKQLGIGGTDWLNPPAKEQKQLAPPTKHTQIKSYQPTIPKAQPTIPLVGDLWFALRCEPRFTPSSPCRWVQRQHCPWNGWLMGHLDRIQTIGQPSKSLDIHALNDVDIK